MALILPVWVFVSFFVAQVITVGVFWLLARLGVLTLSAINPAVLNPRNAWSDKESYEATRDKLASMFIKNFKKYQSVDSEFDFSEAGPKL